MTSEGFLGSGWTFPPRFDARGQVSLSANEEKIRQSIWIILGTAKGERQMRPDFGCDLWQFVFAAVSETTFALIREAVREALILWEPRIEVDAVQVSDAVLARSPRSGAVMISVDYRVRAT